MVFPFYSHLQTVPPYFVTITYSKHSSLVQWTSTGEFLSGAVSRLFASSSSWWRYQIFSFAWGMLEGSFPRKSPTTSVVSQSPASDCCSNLHGCLFPLQPTIGHYRSAEKGHLTSLRNFQHSGVPVGISTFAGSILWPCLHGGWPCFLRYPCILLDWESGPRHFYDYLMEG